MTARGMVAVVVAWLLLAALAADRGQCLAADALKATSSREARKEAINAIPWRGLSHQQQRAVRAVIKESAIYRRLPMQVIDCNPEMFSFLMQRPDVVAETWQEMGVSRLKVRRIGKRSFDAEDGLGTTGRFTFVESTWEPDAKNRALIYAEGGFEGKPLPQRINARCVMLLRSGSVKESNGRTYVTARLDTFLDIDRKGVELVAKAVGPLMFKAADHNFRETLRFVSSFSRAAERNPAGVERFSARLGGVDEATRRELAEISFRAAEQDAQARLEVGKTRPPLAQRTSTGATASP